MTNLDGYTKPHTRDVADWAIIGPGGQTYVACDVHVVEFLDWERNSTVFMIQHSDEEFRAVLGGGI